MKRRLLAAAVVPLGAIAFFALSWVFVDWSDEGSSGYAGGVTLRDSSGGILRVLLGPGDVDCRPFYRADGNDWIVKALVAAEDGEFWRHRGVRPLSVARAAFQNLTHGRRLSGASTITMQTVRLIRPHPKSYWWKWKEAVMALKMERVKDKLWIISQYLNRAPFGSNLVGVEAAAQGWFGKGAKELGLGEAAMLAGMVQAPSRYRPDRCRERALKRREYVLERMRELGMIDGRQLSAARGVLPEIRRSKRPFAAPHYCDWYLRRLGEDAGGDRTTPLDPDVQRICENAVNAAAAKSGCACAAVVTRVRDGEVVAMACSGDYFDGRDGQVNTAVSPRPAGSTLKPFLAALAMDSGTVAPDERLKDAPQSFKGYRPANFDGRHRGRVSLRDALVLSLNLPFVRLLNRVGVEKFGARLRRLGFSGLPDDLSRTGLGMAVGNVEVTLAELTAAYGTVARGGAAVDGSTVFSPAACYIVSEMLSGGERAGAALGHVADVDAARFAWKTGTSSAYRDAWTVAWNPEYAVGVWCGHKRGGFGDRSVVGAKAAAPVCWKISRQLRRTPWFREPPGVVHRKICSFSGLAASADCPETEDGLAIDGSSPATPCEMHRRGADGRVTVLEDRGDELFILRPEDGAEIKKIPGALDQRLICQAAGDAADATVWWFVDGKPAGKSPGKDAVAVEVGVGEHVITCSNSSGGCDEVKVKITD
ncbi:MAG: transglycosylase domain-containing protein [Kiritimatiellae bacterium]|nr:transglycosylase domain-containing protein [Kiritimatiellia bacterium]